jgi:adenine deaminase
MKIHPGMVHTTEEYVEMTPCNGYFVAEPQKDILKIASFYRHTDEKGKTGTKGLGFIRGTSFAPGSAYASTVAHDCHNLLVIGTDDASMVKAANALIETGGGISIVVKGELESVMPLPLAGLMTLESVETAARQVKDIENAFKKAGCPYDSIEMTLSLLGLIVLEELHLSNKGLVELKPGQPPQFVDLVFH